MRKFKRVIALVTAVLFVLAFAAPAGAIFFSDVRGNASDSIYRLNALGIIEGYPDGSFKPDSNITRAEFAKIAMAAAGNAGSANFLKDAASKFSDVKPGEWYTGWVNLAASLGYIHGYPDGSFRPQSNITYAECITILVRLLGYSDKLPGEWPTEYLVKAAELGITDDVTFSVNALATRGNIAMMTTETLDQNLVVWDKDIDDYVFKEDVDGNAYTLLAEKFDGMVCDEDDYMITENWEMNSDGQIVIELLGTIDPFTGEVPETGYYLDCFTMAKDCVVDYGLVITCMLPMKIHFIYNEKDEEITYIDIITTATVSSDVKMDGDKLQVNGVSYKFADGAYNGFIPKADGIYDDYYKVYFNEDNRIYVAAKIDEPVKPHIVEEIKSDLTLDLLDGGSVDLDQTNVLVIRDFQYATIDDIQPGDIVYVYEDEYGCDVFVDAFNPKNQYSVRGKLEAAYETTGDGVFDQVKVGGKKYDLISAASMSKDGGDEWSDLDDGDETFFDDLYDEDVFIVLDRTHDITLIMTDVDSEGNKIYGIIDKVLDEDLEGLVTRLKIMKSDGATVTYEVDSSDVELTYSRTITTYSAEDVLFDGAAVRFQLNDSGDIEDFEVLDDQKFNITDGSENLNKLYINGSWYYVNDDTIVLNGPTGEDPDVVSADTLLSDAETEDIACWVKTDGNKLEYVMIVGDTITGTAEDMAMVIDTYYYNGDNWAVVDIRNEELEYEIDGTVPDVDTLCEYSLAGDHISLDVGNQYVPTTVGSVYGEITDIDLANNAIEVGNDIWYNIDADSYIYDMTSSDPVYVDSIHDIEDEAVFVVPVSAGNDRKGVADVVFIVDEDDYTDYTFSETESAIVE
ncbi:S-layer homology domain-containing protein [Phosphitispora sp. TUW77]|uniref:S-layer homology domain-containing protein n=1 Tax=Phosphitispora sp. TUW77 TaxID=3152361 RepID=UPI003AB7FAC2